MPDPQQQTPSTPTIDWSQYAAAPVSPTAIDWSKYDPNAVMDNRTEAQKHIADVAVLQKLPAPKPYGATDPRAQVGDALMDEFVGAGKSVGQAVAGTSRLIHKLPLIGNWLAPEQGVNALEKETKIEGPAQSVGAGAETAFEMLAGEGAIKNVLLKIPSLAKYAPLVRIAASAGGAATPAVARGENPTIPAVLGAGGSAVSEVAPKLSDALNASAVKSYEDVLNPTKITTKYQTNKIMPQLVEEAPIAISRQGLANKAAAQAENYGQQIEQKAQNLQGTMNLQPVLDGLENYKKSFQVNGVSLRPEVDNAIDVAKDQLQRMAQPGTYTGVGAAPPTLDAQDVLRARRILDSAVAEAGGYQGKSISDTSTTAIRKEVANSFRAELGKSNPDLAALNAKFHFWNTLSDVMDQTIQRKTGQVGALSKVETAVAGAGGLAAGGIPGAGQAGAAMWLLGNTIRSTAWRTMSAAAKSSIADALAAGQFDKVTELLGKAGAATTIQLSQEPTIAPGNAMP